MMKKWKTWVILAAGVLLASNPIDCIPDVHIPTINDWVNLFQRLTGQA
jgi:hypothetical protein